MECLRQYLHERQLTQSQLAKSIGVTQGAISHWLNGRKRPTVKNLLDLSGTTGLSLEKLTDGFRKTGIASHRKVRAKA